MLGRLIGNSCRRTHINVSEFFLSSCLSRHSMHHTETCPKPCVSTKQKAEKKSPIYNKIQLMEQWSNQITKHKAVTKFCSLFNFEMVFMPNVFFIFEHGYWHGMAWHGLAWHGMA